MKVAMIQPEAWGNPASFDMAANRAYLCGLVEQVCEEHRPDFVGLPETAPAHAVNVDCTGYYEAIPDGQPMIGSREHSWHIGDPVFTRELVDNMLGVDRDRRATRDALGPNRYALKRPV